MHVWFDSATLQRGSRGKAVNLNAGMRRFVRYMAAVDEFLRRHDSN